MRLKDGWLAEEMAAAAQRVRDLALHDRALATLRTLAKSPYQDWKSKQELHKQFQEFI